MFFCRWSGLQVGLSLLQTGREVAKVGLNFLLKRVQPRFKALCGFSYQACRLIIRCGSVGLQVGLGLLQTSRVIAEFGLDFFLKRAQPQF